MAPVLAVSLSFTCEDPKARGLWNEFLLVFYVGINSMRCTRDFVASYCASILYSEQGSSKFREIVECVSVFSVFLIKFSNWCIIKS